jgi:dihydrofolate reductase
MGQPRISLVVAHDRKRVIGANGDLPWRLPADLKHFRAITMGKPILMGRRTYESIGRPLPGRTNLIISKTPGFTAAGCLLFGDLDAALNHAGTLHDEVMVIGGAALYRATLAHAQHMYLTEVHAEVPGDVHFPDYDSSDWREIRREEFPADPQHPYPYAFVELERRV